MKPGFYFLRTSVVRVPLFTRLLISALAGFMTAPGALAHPDAPREAQLHPAWVHPPLLAAPAPPQSVDPPLRLTVKDAAGARLRGELEAFDELGFMFRVAGGEQPRRLTWAAQDPDRVLRIHERLLDRDDAEGWLRLGAALYKREADEPGEMALGRALRADPEMTARAGQARRGLSIAAPVTPADSSGGPAEGATPDTEGPGNSPVGPRTDGAPQAAFWGTLSSALMQSSIEQLLEDVAAARKTMGLKLTVYRDSNYFLFVSDMPGPEARRWARVLDRMYDKLCDTFAVPRGTNVFKGRGLIYVFKREADYHRYHRLITGFASEGSAGLCASRGDGRVEITFFRQSDDQLFSHVLVHEAVHGFLHRYRSYPFVVSWANEGLAEFVAADLVGMRSPTQIRSYVSSVLTQAGSTGTMLGDGSIAGWQYPVAQALCDYMIAQDRLRYRDFINAIKDGKPWRDALTEDYGVGIERLIDAFGNALGIRGLKH